ncbi:MAG: hypothetical protein IJW41_02080 [Oscillospiraceae bacterium]|nr:hypothetical protein [Oscillospiraceae bacterium]
MAGVGEGRRLLKAKDIRRAPQQGRYAERFVADVRHKDNNMSPASAVDIRRATNGTKNAVTSFAVEKTGKLC